MIQWADGSRVSFLKKLFGRHPEADVGTSSQFVNWAGQSGHGYQYEIHPINTAFKALPGNYIYARQAEDGSWVPVYIAQTRDLHQRLEGHVTLDDAIANGATHVHVHYTSAGPAARCTEERDLILNWHPVCNDPVES